MKFHQAKILIDAIVESDYFPNEWEENFIESILDDARDLSDRQVSCLQRIYEKSSGGGDYANRQRIG